MNISTTYRDTLKNIFDRLVSLIALIFLSPLFAVVAVLIRIDSKGGVFFIQERCGKDGNLFRIYKFRTMIVREFSDAEITVQNDSRVTRIGKFLREYKLDELPQLINVFFGDMSLVGPRPEVKKYMDLYRENDRTIVLSVRPGITDIASVFFRNESELLDGKSDPERFYIDEIVPKKIKYYKYYVENLSFINDVIIIFSTFTVIFNFKNPFIDRFDGI